jgi:catechol 2,3-dioxygenase-like lactoylglutathione lyase family enzyme
MGNPFGSVHHVCIVVADIGAAVEFYESVGIASWQEYPDLTQFTDLDVPDRDGFLDLKYKYTDAAGLQLQLCQPGPGATPQRKFLDRTGGGVFHIGFVVENVDDSTEEVQGKGLDTWMSGRRPDRTGFTYFQTPDVAGVTLEVRQSQASELGARTAS